MAVAQWPFLAAVLLFVSSGLHCSSSLPACSEPCTCQRAPLLNCSSSGLSLVPQRIQDSVTELDLSHNLLESVTLARPHHNLKNVWLGNNSITRLSLCIERNLGGRYVRGRHLHRLRPWSRWGCVSWAPTLQLLSVERNQLEHLPEGLEGSESLQVLQLSFNRISSLRPEDFSHLRQLIELHLQHNFITSLHPQMFQDLAKLRVLDLSFNMLTSLHPLTYLSLHNIGADVRLGGNRWQCDCSMRSLRRWMAYDSSRGLQAWSVVCASPSILSGRDVLQLEEDDLNCLSTESRADLHQDVTVYSGSEILLSCSKQDSLWWTPSGQASVSQPQAGLLINDITERDTGLYVCVSEEHKVVSVFNLQISKIEGTRRKTRSLPRTSQQIIPQGTLNRIGQERNQRATQSDLTLAVCLSVFITFLIAFILGVLARPCIDVLWRRVTNKNSSPENNSVSSVEQRQYDNEGYFSGEEPEDIGTHRERRVTFSTVDFGEISNVQYYDTVASGDQESINNDAVIECEAAQAEKDTHTAGDPGSENRLQQSSTEENQKDGLSGVTVADRTHNIEFEHIQDPAKVKKRRRLSSCSDSSLSDKVLNADEMTQRDHTTPKTPQLAEDSVQQRADFLTGRKHKVPQMSIEGNEIPQFSSGPFADWSPHTKNPNLTDPDLWQESGEQFEFESDSVRSMSPRTSSVCGSFNDSNLIVAPTSDKQKRDDISSSSSCLSRDEPTEYTVNPEQEEVIEKNHIKPEAIKACLKQDDSFQQQIHGVDPVRPSVRVNEGDDRHDTQKHAVRPKHSFSSHSSDSDGEDHIVKQEKDKEDGSICVSDKVSSKIVTGEWDTRKKNEPMPHTKWRVHSLGVSSHVKSLDTGAPSPPAAYSSSSSSESDVDLQVEQNTGRVNEGIKISEPGTLSADLDCQRFPQFKRHLDISAPLPASDSTSSDESTDETAKQTKRQEQGHVNMAGLPSKKYQSVNHDAMKPQWPSQDFGIKRHLDIIVPSLASESSSSSDSEDEKTHQTVKPRPGKVDMAVLPFQESQRVSPNSETQWPVLNLGNTTHVKRRLDIKAPSVASESSSSSDSENEKTHHTVKQQPEKVDTAGLPFQESQSHNSEMQWPALDLEHLPCINRRLDIKAPAPRPDSSSSSDNDVETTNHIRKQEKGETHMARLSMNVSKTIKNDTKTQWPAIDVEHTKHIKRHPDSSSSSDSEDETTGHTEMPEQGQMARLPIKVSQTESHDPDTRWPVLNLGNTTRIKRSLDIKAPSPDSDSSSSSDSEDETTHHAERPGKMDIVELSFQKSQTISHNSDTRWPALDLEHIPHVKRRLDIKAPSPPTDEEKVAQIQKPEQGEVNLSKLPFQKSQAESRDPGTQWPALDIEHTTRIKRRLDIKAPSPDSDSSCSSDSEDERTHHAERPGKMDIVELAFQKSQTVSHNSDTRWPALDLQHIPHVKRRLDIKVPLPPTDEEKVAQIKKQEQGRVTISRLPYQKSQAESRDPGTQWPALDLEHPTRIKRRLDIKGPSPDSDSSSSSDSEDETKGQIEKQSTGKVNIGVLPFQESQTKSHDPDTLWPALNLENTTRIKRRLDIKAPSTDSVSSSSSDSEDETTHHTERPGKMDIVELAFQKSQTISHNSDTRWPALDLQHIPHVKRRLDIKVPSPPTDEEKVAQIKKQEQGRVTISRLPYQKSQAESRDPGTRWPALDLEHPTRIKRRLDIKGPSPDSDSSSSSDSEDETKGHIEKQSTRKVNIGVLPFKESQTKSHDPDTRWPALNLEHTIRIKRRLDIKAPSPDSDSSSSSDSEDERTHHAERPGKMDIVELAFQKSQTISHNSDTRWPALDLQHIPHVKRRLDIKAPSPPTDEEKVAQIKKQEQGRVTISRLPYQKSQAESRDPETQWHALGLEHPTRTKRRLDIKGPSPGSDSSSSSDSEDETKGHIEKQSTRKVNIGVLPFQESQTSHDPDRLWPALDLGNTTRIKRRLDIKAPSPDSDSSSSSDSEDETTHHTKKERLKVVGIAGLQFQESQTVGNDPETWWPAVDVGSITRIKRRLDIKAPSPPPDSLLSCESTNHKIKEKKEEAIKISPCYSSSSSDEQEEGMEHLNKPPTTAEPVPDSRWPQVDLSSAPHVKRWLDIRARSPPPESSSSSNESEGETRDQPVKVERDRTYVGITSYQLGTKLPDLNMNIPLTERRLNIKAPFQPADSCSSNSDSENRPSSHTVKHERDKDDVGIANHERQTTLHKLSLGVPYMKRRLDIKAQTPQPDPILSSVSSDFQRSESNSSTSDSEDDNGDHAKLGVGVSAISKATEKEFIRSPKTPVIHTSRSPKSDYNIKLEKYTVIKGDVGNKTANDSINTQTPEINPELESRWATMNLGFSRFRKRLEITSPKSPNLPSSPPPDSSSSSSSEKGTGSKSSRTRRRRRGVGMQGIIHTESSLTPESKPVNVSLSLKGQDDNSSNSVEVVEKLRKDYSLPKTEEKSNLDTMLTGFGTPHFRRYRDIKFSEKGPATQPFRQLSDSSSSSEDEDTFIEHSNKEPRGGSQLPVVIDKEASQIHTSLYVTQNVNVKLDQSQSQTEEVERKAGVELKIQTSKVGEEFDLVKPLALDMREPLQRETSSSSNSENETIDHSAPDLSLGFPRIKRRMNVKALLPGPSNSPSSCSENEQEVTGYTAKQSRHASDMSGMTDNDSLITYKRLIFKASSPPSSFDDVIKRIEQSRHNTDVDLPPEIRWTGVGRQLSDHSISSPSRHLDVHISSPQQAPLAELHLFDSFSYSSNKGEDKIKQDRGKADGTLMHKYSSLSANSVSLASSRALDEFDNPPRSTNEILRAVPEDRRERKGLSALKAMSSERRKWETQAEYLDKDVYPVFDDNGPQVDTRFNYRWSEEDISPLAKQPLTQFPQKAPPPLPETQRPDVAVGLTWRSPRSSRKQGLEGTKSYLQQARNTEESDPSSITSQNLAGYFDSSNMNISHV